MNGLSLVDVGGYEVVVARLCTGRETWWYLGRFCHQTFYCRLYLAKIIAIRAVAYVPGEEQHTSFRHGEGCTYLQKCIQVSRYRTMKS